MFLHFVDNLQEIEKQPRALRLLHMSIEFLPVPCVFSGLFPAAVALVLSVLFERAADEAFFDEFERERRWLQSLRL